MFIPNAPCTISSASKETNIYGEKTQGPARKTKCVVLEQRLRRDGTTVRVDSGASRGNAFEITGWVRLGLRPKEAVEYNDRITVPQLGLDLRVVSIYPVMSIRSCVEYKEITCSPWQSG